MSRFHHWLALAGTVGLFLLLPFALPKQPYLPKVTISVHAASTSQGTHQDVLTGKEHWQPLPSRSLWAFQAEPAVFWLRAVIPADATSSNEVTIELPFVWLDAVDFHVLHDDRQAGSVEVLTSEQGLARRPTPRLPGSYHAVTFAHDTQDGEQVLIRVRGRGLTVATVLVGATSDFVNFHSSCLRNLGFFLGCMALFAAFFFTACISLRHRIFAYAGCLTVTTLLFVCDYCALTPFTFDPDNTDVYMARGHTFLAEVTAAALFIALICTSLLGPETPRRIRTAKIFLGYFVAVFMVQPCLPVYWSLVLVVGGSLVAMGVCCALAVKLIGQIFFYVVGVSGAGLGIAMELLMLVYPTLNPVTSGGPLLGFSLGAGILWMLLFIALTLVQMVQRLQTELRDARTRELERQNETLRMEATNRDLVLAREIQDSFQPPASFVYAGRWQVNIYQLKQAPLGGDWMATRQGAEGELVVLVADATGKGVQAALIVHAVQSLWADALHTPEFSPEAWLRSVNRTLCVMGRNTRHTLSLGIMVLQGSRLSYFSAGHVPLFLLSRGSSLRLKSIVGRGDLLGMGTPLKLVPKHYQLEPEGDEHILLGTDGVFDRGTLTKKEGVDAMLRSVAANGAMALREVQAQDDKFLVWLRRLEKEEPEKKAA